LAGGGRDILLVHGDLPLLTPDDVSAVLDARRELSGLVIGCDRHGAGTNLLCFNAASVPVFSFGAGSCAAHFAAATGRGIPVSVVNREGIGLDVDEPEDLAALLRQLGRISSGRTAAYIRRAGLGARIGLALSSLGLPEQQQDRKEVR
jgi:2-phospho-L-lactate guanylyltransferase (CobY/MobA/RfbA family)